MRFFNQCADKHLILVHNKVDDLNNSTLQQNNISISNQLNKYTYHEISISGKYNLGINELETLIYEVADLPEISENTTIVTNARHYDVLTRAHASLLRVQEAMAMNLSGDLIF